MNSHFVIRSGSNPNHSRTALPAAYLPGIVVVLCLLVEMGGSLGCFGENRRVVSGHNLPAAAGHRGVSEAVDGGLTPTTSLLSVSGLNPYTMTCTVKGAVTAGTSGPTGSVSFTDATTNQALGKSTLEPDGSGPAFRNGATAAFSIGMAVGDFDGNGKLDMALGQNSGTLQILLGDGSGSFQPGQQIVMPASANNLIVGAVSAADFNRDGKLDLVVLSVDCCSTGHFLGGTVSVLLGNGDGTFQNPMQIAAFGASLDTGYRIPPVLTGDLNGDGIPDAVFQDLSKGTVVVLLGVGDGTFQSPKSYPVGETPPGMVTGDFNQDGKADLISLHISDNSLSILLGNGDGSFLPQSLIPLSFEPQYIAAGDFNRDGLLDVLVSGKSQSAMLLGNGDGTFQSVTLPSNPTGIAGPIATGDFNGDGILDVVTQDLSSSGAGLTDSTAVWLFSGTGTGTFQTPQAIDVGQSTEVLQAIDLNDDGAPDLISSGAVPKGAGSVDYRTSILINYHAAYAHGVLANAMVDVGAVASHDLQCSYAGDTAYAGSTSNPVTETYTQLPAPEFSPLVGVYSPGQQVTISDAQTGAQIYYTLDGSTPTTSSPLYGSPIVLNETTTVKAIAGAAGYVVSPVSVATYTIQGSGGGTPGTYAIRASALTVAKGQKGTADVTVSSSDSYVGTVALSCSITSSPAGAVDLPTCSAGPNVTLTSTTTSASTNVSIMTTSPSSASAVSHSSSGKPWKAGSGLLAACLIVFSLPRGKRRQRVLRMLVLGIASMAMMQACGSGSARSISPPPDAGTTAGNYVITVSGMGSDSAKTTASTTFTLTVQ